MQYYEAVNRLEGLRRLRPKLGTAATAEMLDCLGDPHADLTAVQVAGSNGKGSTARVLESILAAAGDTVGLYTSPDLNGLRERIRVDGRPIPKRAVCEFVERLDPYLTERAADSEAPTFFEVLTVLALWQFGRADVDVAVLEVGIGGRYDATSVVDPDAAAVTSVSLEHTDIIGSTIEEIAADKATVAPADRPLVTGTSGRALSTVREQTTVRTVGAGATDGGRTAARGRQTDGPIGPDVRAVERGMATWTTSTIELQGPNWAVETTSPLIGAHQATNAGIAAALARQVADVGEGAIAAGIRTTRWPGRFEILEPAPLVVLDGAHNPAACETVSALLERFDYRNISVVFGAMREKDHRAMLAALPPADRVFVAAPTVDRAADPRTLAAVAERATDTAAVECSSVEGAVERAISGSEHADCVLVTGSLYAVSEARDRWTRHPVDVRQATRTRPGALVAGANVPSAVGDAFFEHLGDRTVRLHARRAIVSDLREELRAVGGSAAISGIRATDRHVRALLSGSTGQFRDLTESLRASHPDRIHLARQLESTFDLDQARTADRSRATGVVGRIDISEDTAGGDSAGPGATVDRARSMIEAGAAMVELVTESTKWGPPSGEEPSIGDPTRQMLNGLADHAVPVSIETSEPAVATAALDAGADVITDPTGFADVTMRHAVADAGAGIVLGHGPSVTGETALSVEDVLDDLTERVLLAERAGIDRSSITIAPGVGAGLDRRRWFAFLDRLGEFRALGTGIAVDLTSASPFGADGERPIPTATAAALAADRGATLVRVRDVPATVAGLDIGGQVTDVSGDPGGSKQEISEQ